MSTKIFFTTRQVETCEPGLKTLFTVLFSSLFLLGMLLFAVTAKSQIPVVYSQSFTAGVAPTTQCTAWNAYRSSLLAGYTYSGFNISGSMQPTGITCTDPVKAKIIANSLRTGTNIFGITSDGHNWFVQTACGAGCGGQPSVELGGDVSGGGCSCSSGYSVRPGFGTGNWGGINGPNCGPVSQTMTVTFYVQPVTFVNGPTQSLSLCGNAAASISSLLAINDGEGDIETWTVTGAPAHGVVSGLPATAASDTNVSPAGVIYTPTPGYFGTDVITVQVNNGFQTATTTINVTVNPAPAPISGPSVVCTGNTITLSSATPSGVWTSSNISRATIGAATGLVSGITAGALTITYAAAGCSSTFPLTVNTTPAAITGPSSVCAGSTLTLSDATSGGSWISSSISVATVVSGSGLVSGLTSGVTSIIYTMPGGCNVSSSITVNPSPSAISGPSALCTGSTASFTNAVAGGTWSSSNPSVASVGAGTGSVSAVLAGTTTITYSLPAGCLATQSLTVNNTPSAISGPAAVCVGGAITLANTLAGGTWSLGTPSVATIGSTSGLLTGVAAGITDVTYTLAGGCNATKLVTINANPAAIAGPASVCSGNTVTLTDVTSGGTWSSSNPLLATIAATSGDVSGVASGVAVITYTTSSGCTATRNMTINQSPSAIGGPTNVCPGTSITLSNSVAGGTWSTSSTAIATVTATSGIVTGVTPGTASITYTLAGGCNTNINVIVSPALPAISGSSTVCVGNTATLTDAVAGGTWSTDNAAVIDINPITGLMTGYSTGVVTIDYTLGACSASKMVTANPAPAPITGSSNICLYGTTTLSNTVPSGTWSSSSPSIASIGATSGIVAGMSAGYANITYSVGVGCNTVTTVVVNPGPAPIAGVSHLCVGDHATLTSATSGGVWSTTNSSIASITGSGLVTGVSNGYDTVVYTLPSGCSAMYGVTIQSVPPFTGLHTVCAWGDTISISDVVPGGLYVSTLATVTNLMGGNGIVTSHAPGTATVTYILPSGCSVTESFTVNTLPEQILGNYHVCNGMTSLLTNAYPGGVWSSSNPSIASVGSLTGMVNGVANGTALIKYTLPTGCNLDTLVTVLNPPASISGTSGLCLGASTTFTDTVSGGYWSSSSPAIAAVSSGGLVSGLSIGTATITYNMGASCMATKAVTVSPVPSPFLTVGGGSYCAGGTGVSIYLGGSQTGINYQLYNGSAAVDTARSGSGTYIDFGLQAGAGAYHVVAYSPYSSCSVIMPGSATVSVSPLPTSYSITGGGTYCLGTGGTHVGLASSQLGVNYTLTHGTALLGSPVAGTGSAIDFGLQTASGSYKVVAVNGTTTCTNNMPDSVMVAFAPTVIPEVTLASTGGTSVCPGLPVTITSTPVNGGSAPSFIWKVNGSVTATSGASYSYTPSTGDVVSVIITSNALCAHPDTASSALTLTVLTALVPVVSVSAFPGTIITAGTAVTFTAGVTGGSTDLHYQWDINGAVISGATNDTYTTSSLANGDIVNCVVTSNGPCGPITANSHLAVTVNPSITLGVNPALGNNGLSIMPNPSKGNFTLSGQVGSETDGIVTLEVTNMLGQIVYKNNVQVLNRNLDVQIALGNECANGMYLVNVLSGNQSQVFHLVKEQ